MANVQLHTVSFHIFHLGGGHQTKLNQALPCLRQWAIFENRREKFGRSVSLKRVP